MSSGSFVKLNAEKISAMSVMLVMMVLLNAPPLPTVMSFFLSCSRSSYCSCVR